MEDLKNDVKKLKSAILSLYNIYINDKECNENTKKGSRCSTNGKKYEDMCYENIKHSAKIVKQGGGSSHQVDIYTQNGHIECKPSYSPDWGQCRIKWKDNSWVPINNIFQKYMGKVKFKPPPFEVNKITYEHWLNIKHDYRDEYIYIDNQEIQNFYKKKDCAYIQIKGYGLYHLGEDPLELKVPEFKLKQRIRIRAKVHSKTNSQLSVTAAFQPVNIKQLKPSIYSLDDKTRIPPNL